MHKEHFISAIILAGGKGTRLQSETPKQFLLLKGKPLAAHSIETLAGCAEIKEIILVCDPAYQYMFATYPSLRFALPGEQRCDSLFHGLLATHEKTTLVCVHDAARPFVSTKDVIEVINAAKTHGSAILGSKENCTLKNVDETGFVRSTIDRTSVWQAHTPQVAPKHLLKEAYLYAKEKNYTITDESALIELLGHPIKMVPGSRQNIKITTQEDWDCAIK